MYFQVDTDRIFRKDKDHNPARRGDGRYFSCEGGIGFHVGQVERHGLITASGASPVVEVESIECFTVREDLYGQ